MPIHDTSQGVNSLTLAQESDEKWQQQKWHNTNSDYYYMSNPTTEQVCITNSDYYYMSNPATEQVCIRSDSYLGLEEHQSIRLDVQKAREIPTQHPQWQECSSDEDEDDEDDDEGSGSNNKARDEDSEFTTDDETSGSEDQTDEDDD